MSLNGVKDELLCVTKDVSVTATFEARDFTIPEQSADLRKTVEREYQQRESSSDHVKPPVNMNLNASLEIQAKDASGLLQSVETSNFFFRQMIREIEEMSNRGLKKDDAEAIRLRLAKEFQNDVQEVLSHDPRHLLVRQNSSTFVDSFTRAESILEQGSKGYVEALRKLIVTGNESVNVVMKDVSFVVPNPPIQERKGPTSVGTVLCDAIMFPFRKVGSCITNSGYSKVSPPKKVLLNSITAQFKTGRLTLVLGPPGSSKSLFLKALSGNLYQAPGDAKFSGTIQYNGYDAASLKNLASWVSYVHQTDEHLSLLTTRETLEFAWRCRREPLYDQLPKTEKFAALKAIEVDIILATLGLKNCAETYIGDSTLKGVSGGEKRRVTLGEKLVTGSQVFAMDEISTGLDAAATFDIIAHLSSVCHLLGQTVIVALLQPPPEVIDLFDDIVCLAEGHIIYHGERAKVLEYFESIGFKIPERMEIGDFLQTVPTKGSLKFYDKPNIPPPRNAADFAQLWKSTEAFKREEAEISQTLDKKGNTLDNQPQIGLLKSVGLLSKIMLKLRMREISQLAAKVFSNVIMGAFFGSLFWQLDLNESFMKAMLLFQIPSFMFSTTFPNVQILGKQKPVFLKHLDGSFYSPLAFTISQFLVSLPFIIFDVGVFGNIVYWSTGLANDASTFVTFLILMLAFAVTITTTFNIFPFLAPDETSGVMLAVLFLLLCFLNCGVIATPDIIPDYISWLFWINPLAWILRALSINEYHSGGIYDQNPCRFEILGKTITVHEKCGDYFLEMRQIKTEDYWIWACYVFMTVFSLISLSINVYAAKSVRFEEPRSQRILDEDDDGDEEEEGRMSSRPMLMRQESITIPSQQLIVKDLSYSVRVGNEDVKFLKKISFWTTPGRMTALMGSSGAGKTTLMDVIAGRKTTGSWTGQILIDGAPKVQSEFVRYAAYVEQFGVHSPAATVLESLKFSAELRLPRDIPAHRKQNFMEEQLEILELEELKDSLCSSLSMEQNKRLTLGVELVANPSIVFADEPTSSLDARAAAIVMRVLSKIARSGRTVICTIHQPSTEVFFQFDDLLLLKRGGEIVYFGELGERGRKLIEYFEKIPGTSRCPLQANPSTWMLEVIGAGTTSANQNIDEEGNIVDFALIYRRSDLKQSNDKELERFLRLSSGYVPRQQPSFRPIESPQKILKQLYMLLERNFQAYWRTISFTLARYVVILIIAGLFSLIFWQQKLTNVADIQSRVILIFFSGGILSLYNLYTVIPFAMARLPVFYRERATGMYSVTSHVVADALVEIPFVIIEIFLAITVLYFSVGMNSALDRILYYYLDAFALVYLMTMVGLMFAALLPDPLSAQLSAISFVQVLQIFSGILVQLDNLPRVYKPLYYFSPFMWSSEGLVTTQFYGDDTPICAPFGKIPSGSLISHLKVCTKDGSNDLSKISGVISTVEEFALGEFLPDFHYEHRWKDIVILVIWLLAIRILTTFIVIFVNHNKR